MRLFFYYTQSDLKQMAKLIGGWEKGKGGGAWKLGRTWGGGLRRGGGLEAWKDVWKGVFFACIYSFKATEYLRILKIFHFFKLCRL